MENCCGYNNMTARGPALGYGAIKNIAIQKKLDIILAEIHSVGLSLKECLIIFDFYQKHPEEQNSERSGFTFRGVFDTMSTLLEEITILRNKYWKITGTRISTGPELEENINLFESLQLRKSEFFPEGPGLDLEKSESGTAAVFSLPVLGEISTTKILLITAGLIIGYCLIKK